MIETIKQWEALVTEARTADRLTNARVLQDAVKEIKRLHESLAEIAGLRGNTIHYVFSDEASFDDGCERAFDRCADIADSALEGGV
jgi:hypothetical protein